jgi:hypothetical protein
MNIMHCCHYDEYYEYYALLVTSIYSLLQHPVIEAGIITSDKQLEEFYCLTQMYYHRAKFDF